MAAAYHRDGLDGEVTSTSSCATCHPSAAT